MSELLILCISIIFVAIAAIFFETSWRKGWIKQWLSRKLLHITAISACSFIPLIIHDLSYLKIIVIGAELALLVLVGKFDLFIEKSGRKSWGIALFPIPYIILLFLFENQRMLIAAPMLILAIADAAACIMGTLFARKTFELTGDRKSIVGSFAFFIVSLIIIFWFKANFINNSHTIQMAINGLSIAIMLTLAEQLGSKGTDNLLIPVFAALFLSVDYYLPPIELEIEFSFLIFALGLFLANKKIRWLSPSGLASAIILGYTILRFSSWEYLMPIVWFLGSGSLLSKLNKTPELSDNKSGKARDWVQVISNGSLYATAIILGLIFQGNDENWMLKIFAIMAVVTADTWSSEIGKRYSTRAFDLFSFRLQSGGISGGISFIGSLGGLLGAISIAIIAMVIEPELKVNQLLIIIGFGFLGMLFDSILGALFQRRFIEVDGNEFFDSYAEGRTEYSRFRVLSNDSVNLLSPLIVFLI